MNLDFTQLGRNLLEFWDSVRVIDLVDVLFISGILYVTLTWLRRTAARSLIVAGLFLVVAYLVAELLQITMTLRLLQAVFAVTVIGMLILYQVEIRRAIDRLAVLPFRRGERKPTAPDVVRQITEAAANMAQRKVGALIVWRGREALDAHIEGGIAVGGRASVPLLLSIFNPTSPGHDGAAILEGDRLAAFAAHLPLSTNLEQIGRRGTRHTAALGLSERSDAIVVVVSEERGVISVAEAAKLTELATPVELSRRLEDFWRRHYHQDTGKRHAWRQEVNLPLAGLSVVLAILFWFAFRQYEPPRPPAPPIEQQEQTP